ncbi:type VI secretion system baseplate subunit TssF [Paraburkholderia edwinii]|uniref:Type VI secretion system baseplate subunit TssF n=1 Tax=Paraburkholderia edwinii TaxID=2861782 RepID=A0ABX8URU6_9BURK|nr:type VI secretion system baseplate subunit TssF [Paraburkholderia edwinii]QYD71599.1 type VI secretion system baseplate subunit TssF [Paraburkholderia edwinii]
MNDSLDDLLLDYYQRELTYLRRASESFAQRYPKIARRLQLGPAESADPHVERLLESFAVLTARIQRTLDDEYSELTDGLLEQFYPYASRPLPSMTIVQFNADPTQGSVAEGYTVPRDTPLTHVTADGTTLRWRTCADVTLWPVELRDAQLLNAEEAQALAGDASLQAALRLTVCTTGQYRFDALPIKRLRVRLAGSPTTAAALYDLLCAHATAVYWQTPGEAMRVQPGCPEPLGFSDEQALLPLEDGVHPACRLLVEYLAFPEKFAFFDLPFVPPQGAGDRVDLLIGFRAAPGGKLTLHTHDFALGCAPAINLFARTSEPLRPDATLREMRLSPDAHREASSEIYAVRKVRAVSGRDVVEVPPYYGVGHGSGSTLYWHARRVTGMHPSRPGSDVMLTFVDTRFDPTVPSARTLTAELLCTNRHLAHALEPGAALSFEAPGPVASVRIAHRPTPQVAAALDGSSRWRLASQFVLNHASLVSGPQALQTLREMLELHNLAASSAAQRQIAGVASVGSEAIVAHVGEDLWRGWRNGLKVRIELDPTHFVGTSTVLFSGVLAHFFSLYASVNRFVHTALVRDGREIHTWRPKQGSPLVL